MPDTDAAMREDPDRLIQRALNSVLETVPEPVGGDATVGDAGPQSQPWAETAAPPGRDKRPLEEVVAELAARVAAAPDARAGAPAETHPATAYLDSLAATGKAGPKPAGRRRWHGGRRRRGRGRRGGGASKGGTASA